MSDPGSSPAARCKLWPRASGLAAGLALALVAIRLQAQLWETPGDLASFWWLLVVGVLFAVLMDTTFGPSSIAPPELHLAETRAAPTPNARRRYVILLTATFVAEAVSLGLFRVGWLLDVAWVASLAACVLFLVGLWRATGVNARAVLPGWTRVDTVAVALLLSLALIARLWQVRAVPEGIWFDEAQRGLEALTMLAERDFRPIVSIGILQEPTGLWYLIAPLVALLGRDPLALRLPTIVAGTLGVGAIYLLARYLYGWRTAVAAAGLTIGFSWHLTFSRIALPAIPSVTCDTLAVALLLLGLRTGNRFLLGSAGVVAATGLHFYFTSQMLPVVLIAIVAYHVVVQRRHFLRQNGVGLACLAVGYFLAAGPIIAVTITDPGRLTARASTVSVFKEVETAGSWQPLIHNVQAHLLMFNVKGDPNGRHNWSGRPMLDPVTGGLAVAGLALCLLRPRRIERAVPLIWLPVAMLGGIFSLSFEAPQSHRAIDALVPAILLAALPIGLLWGEFDRLLGAVADRGRRFPVDGRPRPARYAVAAGLVLVALGATNAMNLGRYFGEQQPESRTWAEMSSPQTLAGRQIALLPTVMPVYLEPSWMGHPSIRFLDGRPHQYRPFDPSANLPVTDAEAAIFIADRPPLVEQLDTLYPTAQRTAFQMPNGVSVGGYGYVLPADVLQASRGVAAQYWSPAGTVERREAALDFDWTSAPPLPAPFDATFTATLAVPTDDQYQLVLEGPPTLTLTLDGVDIMAGGERGVLPLARGKHLLRLTGIGLGQEPVRLLWAPQPRPPQPIASHFLYVAPVETTGLLARLYPGERPAGEPRIRQVDPNINVQVHLLPLPRPYTVEWSGAIRIEQPGLYRFSVGDFGAFSLWIDDVLLAESDGRWFANGEVDLDAGWHDIVVRFVDRANFAAATAYWQPPGRPREIIPTSVLRPWPAARVAAARPEDANMPVRGETSTADAPRLTPTAASGQLVPSRSLAELGAGQSHESLGQPRGIASGPDGALYVVEGSRKVVTMIGPDGSSRALGDGALKEPSAVAVLPYGALYVLDAGAGAAFGLDAEETLGERVVPGQEFYGPRGLTATGDGRLIVADTGNDRVLIGTPSGSPETITGLAQPTSAVVLQDGTLLVVETASERIVQLGANGVHIASWTMPPSATVPAPQALALPDGGWVVSHPEQRALILRRGSDGPVEQRPLGEAARRPSGLLLDQAGRLVVGDSETGTLRTFSIP
jgi:Dolichyl-phosphate-mannose-protein mannosyltransferase/PA14 domain